MGRHWKRDGQRIWRNDLERVTAILELTPEGLQASVVFDYSCMPGEGRITWAGYFDSETQTDQAKLYSTKQAQWVQSIMKSHEDYTDDVRDQQLALDLKADSLRG